MCLVIAKMASDFEYHLPMRSSQPITTTAHDGWYEEPEEICNLPCNIGFIGPVIEDNCQSFFTCGQLNATLYNDCPDGYYFSGLVVRIKVYTISSYQHPATHSATACPSRQARSLCAATVLSPWQTAASAMALRYDNK